MKRTSSWVFSKKNWRNWNEIGRLLFKTSLSVFLSNWAQCSETAAANPQASKLLGSEMSCLVDSCKECNSKKSKITLVALSGANWKSEAPCESYAKFCRCIFTRSNRGNFSRASWSQQVHVKKSILAYPWLISFEYTLSFISNSPTVLIGPGYAIFIALLQWCIV